MRLKITASLVILLFAFGCKKDSNSPSIIGKWYLHEDYVSPGGLLTATPYIQFAANGQVQSNMFTMCTGYKVTGSNSLTLDFNGQAIPTVNYLYTIKQDTLTMSEKGCTEGCSIVFVKGN